MGSLKGLLGFWFKVLGLLRDYMKLYSTIHARNEVSTYWGLRACQEAQHS